MSNLEILKKLSLGKEDTQKVTITVKDNDYDFILRPLTSGELTKLQKIEKHPLNLKIEMKNGVRQNVQSNDVDINTGEFAEAQNETMYTAIAWSMSTDNEKVTVEDIKTLPTGVPEAIFTKVIEISSLSDEDLTIIKSFRKNGQS